MTNRTPKSCSAALVVCSMMALGCSAHLDNSDEADTEGSIASVTEAVTASDYVSGAIGLLQMGQPVDITMTQTVGTLTQGTRYRLTWSAGAFTARQLPSGPSYTYSNANLAAGQVSLWGVQANLVPNWSAPNLSAAGYGSIAQITGWPYSWYWFDALGPSRVAASTFNIGGIGCPQYTRQCFFQTFFEGTLRGWVTAYGATVAPSTLASLMESLFVRVKPWLQRFYPGLSDAHYKGLMVQNLVNGFYEVGVGPINTQPLATVLAATRGSCGTVQELVRHLGQILGLNVQNIVIDVDYLPAGGGGVGYYAADNPRTPAVHAINLLTDSSGSKITLDGLSNISVALGKGTVAAAILGADAYAFNRFYRLPRYGFWNYYLQPDVRARHLKAGLGDTGVVNMAYSYYFESFRAPPCSSSAAPCVPSGSTNQWFLIPAPGAAAVPL